MPSLQIRDMPLGLYEALKASAENDHRSLAQQAIVLLAAAIDDNSQSKTRRLKVLKDIQANKLTMKNQD